MAVISSGGGALYEPGRFPPRAGFPGSPLYDWMAELDPEGYFGNWLGKQGYMGLDTQSDLMRSLMGKLQLGHAAAKFDDPDIDWISYLDQYQNKLPKLVAGMGPESRGIDKPTYVGSGSTRILPRTR